MRSSILQINPQLIPLIGKSDPLDTYRILRFCLYVPYSNINVFGDKVECTNFNLHNVPNIVEIIVTNSSLYPSSHRCV